MQEADDAFDMIILIMVLAIFTPIMVYCSIPLFKGEVGGFNVQIEKTALETESEIVPSERKMTTNDVLLMLVVADKFAPEPRNIRLNVWSDTLEIPVNEEFLLNRELKLQEAKGAMPDNIDVNMQLYSGPLGMRFWNVNEVQP
ncbi:hypothetical protein [Paenibacillus sinopodophylli]|uniref:hypothetical protein n=1 Tax=Paenibacillus sinopodophylli TaxID=1837342 RepID=UPI00110CCEFD|nr:hypothetical protein [Paenibacillus sinopodophylli]